MCGLAGIALPQGQDVDPVILQRMNGAMVHRGPDGDGAVVWNNVGLAHRRLSIIDLEAGAQPIFNEDRSVVVVFNGEIYNYRELTKELVAAGHVFRTHSDTETLVHLYEQYGIEMLSRLRGMFVFALYDRPRRVLYVVRDRYGIKPAYFCLRKGGCYFASEIRPILAAGQPAVPNPAAIDVYLRTRFAHTDETIFKGIHRLPEGTYLRWQGDAATLHRYYPTPFHASNGHDPRDHQELFDRAFASAVDSHMVADVEVGAYLSGGIDSTALVSEMVNLGHRRVRTFCIDFEGPASEARAAEATARELDCAHTTIACSVEDLLELPTVIQSLEEPIGDAVIVPQYALARATRAAGIKVVMTGDGADEVLAGYQYLRAIIQAERWAPRLPELVSRVGPAVARSLPLGLIDRLAGIPLDVAEEARERFATLLGSLHTGTIQTRYDLLLALYRPDEVEQLYTPEFRREVGAAPLEMLAGEPSGRSIADKVLSVQYRKWLSANMNIRGDKLCMAHSVENRVPFLDHELVELLATFPERTKLRGKVSKVMLRDLVRRRLGPARAMRPKKPLHMPLERYITDPRLRDMVEDSLEESQVKRRGIVRYDYVRLLRARAAGGDYMETKKLFALVILELWFRAFVDGQT